MPRKRREDAIAVFPDPWMDMVQRLHQHTDSLQPPPLGKVLGLPGPQGRTNAVRTAQPFGDDEAKVCRLGQADI